MLLVAKQYSEAIDEITSKKELKLRAFELTAEEWGIVDDLIHVLKVRMLQTMLHSLLTSAKVYKDATVFFSSNTPTIANVIPTMDIIEDMLTDEYPQMLHPAVKSAMTFTRTTMDRYYSKTDHLNVYRIAMGTSSAYLIIAAHS